MLYHLKKKMDHTLLTTEEFDMGLLQQYELTGVGFNVTFTEIGVIEENQLILFNTLWNFYWLVFSLISLMFLNVISILYLISLLEKKDEEVVNAYVELKNPVCV